MARKSKADRINEVLRLNPALSRNDPRISELIDAEALLRKAQRAAMNAPVTVETRNGGTKRSPELIAVESANAAVRRLRNDLGIDRINVKRSEAAGIKVKRSPEADRLLSLYGADYCTHRVLLPGLAAFLTAHGIGSEDMPEHSREMFVSDVAEQAELVDGIRDRIKGT
ncbi:hypothetical protein [Burkholderia cepacia]|uniref:hypothetical protein n=1 Tax=Burkholderia cepacia TaxID=292 RepID=UPI00075C176B|nr:hypothetical protein [Burkholderia cepacia]